MSAVVAFPRMRWLAAAWLAVWLPVYLQVYGPANLLFLCDLAAILTCIGLWRGSAVLLSSQAVSSLVVDAVWVADVLARIVSGRHLIGGTEYMWDPQIPLFVRSLSLFHVGLPILLLWALRHVGYDRRALALQSALAVVATAAARFTSPEANIDYAFTDPFLKRAWGPPPVHVVAMVGGLVALVYWPTHVVLARLFGPPVILRASVPRVARRI